MHLKVFPLLMLSCFFFLPSNCFLQNKYFVEYTNYPRSDSGDAVPINIGSYSLFAGRTGSVPFYGFNANTRSTSITNSIWSTYVAYTTVGDVAYITSRNTVDNTFFAFNGTSGQVWTLKYGQQNIGQRAFTSVGSIVVFAGGQYYNTEASAWLNSNFVGLYDTTTQSFSNTTLPFARTMMTAASAGNYALFAGGQIGLYGSAWSSDVAIFNMNTRQFTTASLTSPASENLQAVSIGRFAIFVSGNVADIFDSTTQTWSTHTLSQSSSSAYGFSIVKTQRYVFFVASGKADVFDSISQTWSTLIIDASTTASYCPSTIVGDYAIFSCDTLMSIYDIANNNFVRRIQLAKILQAGAVGNIATFLVAVGNAVSIYTMDFTYGAPNSDTLTPQSVSPTQVSSNLATHQLSMTRTGYTAADNKAVFISNDISVDIYNAETNAWTTSTPNVATRGGLYATADTFVVFSDTANSSLLHALDLTSSQWNVIVIPQEAREFLITVGNYLFFNEIGVYNYVKGALAYNLNDNTKTSLEWEGTAVNGGLYAIKYRTYAIFANTNARYYVASGYDTANNLAGRTFSYGGESRIIPLIAPAGDYLVIAGGVLDTGYSDDFSIYNPYDDQFYTGKMPSSGYGLTIVFVEPLMLFIKDNIIQFFNMDTQQWTVGFLDVYCTASVVSGHKWFVFNDANQNNVAAFDSHTNLWYNITVGEGSVGKLSGLGDLAAFLNSDSILVYNPSTENWTKSTFSGKQFKDVFAVGDKAVFISSDGTTIDTVALNDLISGTSTPPVPPPVPTPVAPPVTGQSSVNPTDDATVRNGIYAGNNYAIEPTMYIKYSTNPDFTRQIYVKFPLQNLLPTGSSRVVVRLLGYYQSTLGPLSVQCYAVPNNSWTQSSITWNNKPALGALLATTDITHPIAYYEWDVTSYVNGQRGAGASYVSFAFVRSTPGPDESTVLVNSLEADVNRPMLAITN